MMWLGGRKRESWARSRNRSFHGSRSRSPLIVPRRNFKPEMNETLRMLFGKVGPVDSTLKLAGYDSDSQLPNVLPSPSYSSFAFPQGYENSPLTSLEVRKE